MGSLNSGLLNIDNVNTLTDTLEFKNVSDIRSISNNTDKIYYNNYNELDKYKYYIKEYWKNILFNYK